MRVHHAGILRRASWDQQPRYRLLQYFVPTPVRPARVDLARG